MTAVTPAGEQRFAAVTATVNSLGPELAQAATSDNFAGMLAAVQKAAATLYGGGSLAGASAGAGGSGSASAAATGSAAGTASTAGTSGTAGSGSLFSAGLASSVSGAMSASGATSVSVQAGSPGPTGRAVVSDALRYLGVPYQWGGTSPTTGFDCSGLVQHVYADLGISLPRTSQQQATVGQAVPNLASAKPGDLLFFEPGPSGPGHVGIYIGGNQMIDAPHTGTTVQVQTIWAPPSAIRRVVGATTSPGSAGVTGSLGVPSSLAPTFLAAAAKYGISPQLLAAVAKVESNFNPSATSSAGAEGLMQIMPGTAQGLGINPYDPTQAIYGAAKILSGNLAQFGSVPLALAAYNAGAGAVQQYGGIPPYSQTQAYVSTIMGLLGGVS